VNRVLDAHALMAYLEKEPGYEKVRDAFVESSEKGIPLLMSVVNYGEVYYSILRECGPRVAEDIEKTIQALPIEVVDANIDIAREAGRFKAKYRISYADCFAAALAKLKRAVLITGDPEFMSVEYEIKIEWLNQHGT
jgi:uncharacterized protein with PIN domain